MSGEEEESQKYPHLNRSYGVSYDDEVPPPIPPRPPDTLPPPPPPTSLPPGPPEVHYQEGVCPPQLPGEDDEPYPQVPHGYENGEVSESDKEEEKEEEEEEEEEEAPPIPPRGKSLSPETKGLNAAGRELVNGSTAGHFLGRERGDAASQSPLSDEIGTAGGTSDDVAPPTPEQSSRKRGPEGDEEALLSELNEIENIISEREGRETHLAQQENQQM